LRERREESRVSLTPYPRQRERERTKMEINRKIEGKERKEDW